MSSIVNEHEEHIADNTLNMVEHYCLKHRLFSKETVLVALSGGGDSVCLLDILTKLSETFGLTIVAAHLNHALRGDASDSDETFCRKLCDNAGIPLITKRLDPGELNRTGTSVETAARNARQKFLLIAASEYRADKIATGHTLSDQAETVMQRIIRGTGPSGLAGILPVREGRWVRPLLCLDRPTVRKYLRNHNITYIEDETNDDPKYFRNRIRHRLLPIIRKDFSPGIDNALVRLADITAVQEEWISGLVLEAYEGCLIHADNHKILLEKARFLGYHTLLQQRIVRHCLRHLEGAGRDDEYQEIEITREHIRRNRAKHSVTETVTAETDNHIITFTRSLKRFGPIPIEVPGTTILPYDSGAIKAHTRDMGTVSNVSSQTLIPCELITRFGPLTVGSVLKGETISLERHQKNRKIRDLYSTAEIPSSLRNSMPVVRAGAVPVWIPGLTASDVLVTARSPKEQSVKAIRLVFNGGIVWQK